MVDDLFHQTTVSGTRHADVLESAGQRVSETGRRLSSKYLDAFHAPYTANTAAGGPTPRRRRSSRGASGPGLDIDVRTNPSHNTCAEIRSRCCAAVDDELRHRRRVLPARRDEPKDFGSA